MEKGRVTAIVADGLRLLSVAALLSLVCATCDALPTGEWAGQWAWFDKAAVAAAAGVACSLALRFRVRAKAAPALQSCEEGLSFSTAVSWSLVAWGAVQALAGLSQLYGFAPSRHSLYDLTGSFFNPGPYSGYLAVVLPLCLHRWLLRAGRVESVAAGGALLAVLAVLPAGMSRSAWLAAGVSCLWVYGCHAGWGARFRTACRRHGRRVALATAGAGCLLLLAGCLLFALKPDSARGRLFMWRMAGRAIAERPWTGYGPGGFAASYGDAQEAYFAAGGYEPWEERVAGSPEYAFNEYLHVAVVAGVPALLCLLAVAGICLRAGTRRGRYGICGALLSLMVFAFSSYPLQIPVFVVTAVVLSAACVAGDGRRTWMAVALLAGATGLLRLPDDLRQERACCEWVHARMLYNTGAYGAAEEVYARLYPQLKGRAAFLFEYGHGLHKQQKWRESNRLLEEALQRSCDPMILNVMGKNHQQLGHCQMAEHCLLRSTHRLPGRIYPYYLLAKLYADPRCRQPEKFEEMRRIVLTKEPKVNSTAIRQMREEVGVMKNEE